MAALDRDLSTVIIPKPKLVPSGLDAPSHHEPTEEQSTIYTAGRGPANLMLTAYAGTGKSHTLEELQHHVPERLRTTVRERNGDYSILYLVFNRKNADEAADKMLSTTACRTFNGMGHRIWAATGRSLGKPDARKPGTILREYINEGKRTRGERDALWAAYDQVVSGVNLAKALG